jgi:hypothetical protein
VREYVKNENVHACKLTRSDLIDLVSIFTDSMSSSDEQVQLELSGQYGDVSVKETDVTAFLENHDLPRNLKTLAIRNYATGENFEVDKSISIQFYDSFISLYVSGKDETWVLGKYSQIMNFLNQEKPWFSSLRKIFPLLAGVIIGLVGGFLGHSISSKMYVVGISTSILLVATILLTIYFLKNEFLPHTQIIIDPNVRLFTKENMSLAVLILSFIVSLVSGVIIPLLK